MFYLIYYTCLTGYFLAMLFIFYQTLDDNEPKWLQKDGIIGDNPGEIPLKSSTLFFDNMFNIGRVKSN